MIKVSILELGIFFYICVIGHYIYYPFILRNPKLKKGIEIGLIAKGIKDQNFKESYAYWLNICVFISNTAQTCLILLDNKKVS